MPLIKADLKVLNAGNSLVIHVGIYGHLMLLCYSSLTFISFLQAEVSFPVACHLSPLCEAVGGPTAGESHSLAPVPSPVFPSFFKPGALP